MELDHEFTVPAPADVVWPALLDIERMAPLLPGVTHESGTDGEYLGKAKLKFGPMSVTYKGSTRIAVIDELTRTIIVEADAREARGSGTGIATFQATVHSDTGQTRVTVHSKVELTGRPAELSRHLVSDTGARLLGKFARALAAELAEKPPAETATVAPEVSTEVVPGEEPVEELPPALQPEAAPPSHEYVDAGDLGDLDSYELSPRPSVARRAASVLAALLAVFAVRHVFRRRRGRHHG
ncbi:MAG: SRPBCC family protein [Streptosporangiaceae bacterium]